MDVPVWPDDAGRDYATTPRQVLSAPEKYPREFARVQSADTRYPIDVIARQGRLMILDGIHRLARTIVEGRVTIEGRFISASAVRKL